MTERNVLGSLTALASAQPDKGISTAFKGAEDFVVQITGTFVGTIDLEVSFDQGTTWGPVSRDVQGAPTQWVQPITLPIRSDVSNAWFRLKTSAWTSGAANYGFWRY